LKRLWVGTLQFVHVNVSFYGVFKVHQRLKDSKNYYLLKYEDVVKKPDETLNKLCQFLCVPFTSEMLKPKVRYNTSYGQIKISKGFHRSSVDTWQKKLPKSITKMIRLFNREAIRELGYY
jgi:hypothetical protein